MVGAENVGLHRGKNLNSNRSKPKILYRQQSGGERSELLAADERWNMVRQYHLITVAGMLLGAHFGSWVMSIENTSLSHALLVSSTSPIIMAFGSWVLREPISNGTSLGNLSKAMASLIVEMRCGVMMCRRLSYLFCCEDAKNFFG